MTTYGFLGLGIMGSAMATNLQRAGFPLSVWNRSRSKTDTLASQGARVYESPAEVVAESDITFAMVADPVASRDLCFGTGGVLEAITEGKRYVDISTVDPETAVTIAKAITAQGGRFLEAPVSGSKKPAEDGTLVFLCGGDRQLFDEVAPALEVMGKKSFYFGEAGKGAQMKLVVNMVMGITMTALAEGLALGQKCGLGQQDILDVMAEGAIANPMFRLKGPQLIERDYPTAFPLKHMQKDLRLALQLAKQYQQPLNVAASCNDAFLKALQLNLGDADMGAVMEAVLQTTK